MSISHLFGAVVGAAHSAVEGLASLLTPFAGGLSVALAIVAFTVLVRLALSPLTYLQVRAGRHRAALAPQLAALREKHPKDPVALATETLALQRANGVGPFAGLLPGLVQAPFFMVMYSVARHAPAGAVFGIPLSAHLVAGLPIFAVLLVIAGLVAWRSSRRSAAAGPAGQSGADHIALLRYLPYLTVLTVAWLPLAAALYLVTSSAWTGLEQAFRARPALTGNS